LFFFFVFAPSPRRGRPRFIFVTGHSYTFSFSREYFTMIQKVSSFLKKDTVLTIALALAVLSMFIIPPSAEYLGYLDLHTLILLFGLMTATTGLQNIGFFRQLGELLLLRIHSLRQLEQLLILLCFFSSMLITNDVSLITFVPFALELLRMVNRKDRIVPVVVCQTLAANLGSMTTPVGNPQNLYLYSHFELSLDTFIRSIGPFSLLSLVLLLLITMFTPRETISLDTAGRDTTSDETFPKRCLFCCLGMFFLCLCTVAGLLPLPILFICILAIGCLADPKIFCQVDYSLILTFIGFFIFIGNLKHIPAVSSLLSSMITGHEVIVSVLASQVISNVPAAILLSGFTEKGVSLLIGTNLGGLGTLIASMASLISYKYIIRSCPEKKGIYFRWFTIANAGFLAVLMAVYFLVFYSI